MDTCICIAESLCYSPETNTTLFVNWLFPNTKKKKKKNCCSNYKNFSQVSGFPGGSGVKNLHAMQVTRVQSLGHGDLLKEGMATHLSVKSHGQRSLAEYIHRVAKSWT